MKRRQFLKAAGLGVAASAGCRTGDCAINARDQMAHARQLAKSLDTLWGGCEVMAKAVAEATDNKFQIQTFAAGEIVPGLAIVDAVQNGTVEIGHTASYYYFGKDPTFAFGTSVAFGPNARLNQGWFTLGGGKEVLNEFYKKTHSNAKKVGIHFYRFTSNSYILLHNNKLFAGAPVSPSNLSRLFSPPHSIIFIPYCMGTISLNPSSYTTLYQPKKSQSKLLGMLK